MSMKAVNPTTGEMIREYEAHSAAYVEEALQHAHTVFHQFGRRNHLADRTKRLNAAADILIRDKAKLAALMTAEMGKPIAQSEAEIEKCAAGCRHYAEHAESYLADSHTRTGRGDAYVRWLPVGPILAVMPWNFPFWQVFRFAAPALAAGNVCLLKHASNVPGCAIAIEEIFREAGFPNGTFQTLLVGSDKVAAIIADDRVKAVTLTGSEGAGRQVGAAAGKAIKPSVLELGGSDPFIVMPSADIDAAVKTAVTARIQNTGQSCIAAKRFIIHQDVYLEFAGKFTGVISALKYGDPMDRANHLGPLATYAIRDELAKQVEDSVAAGATVLCGGKIPGMKGAFYEPTVIGFIPEAAPAFSEELFGPVASLYRAKNIDEAIRLANITRFGLGSAAWTADKAEQARFIDEIEAGFTAINGMTTSDPRLPFGGVKASGYGRELADLGMQAFLNAKTVTVA